MTFLTTLFKTVMWPTALLAPPCKHQLTRCYCVHSFCYSLCLLCAALSTTTPSAAASTVLVTQQGHVKYFTYLYVYVPV